MCRFLALNLILIANYFQKVLISHIIANHWKNQLYYEPFSFNLTAKSYPVIIYPIVQPSSLKLPMDLECIQISGLKNISLTNVRGDSIFTLPGKVPLWQKCQNDVLCGHMNMDVSPYILKFKFFYKNNCSTKTAWIHVGLL